MRRRYTIKRLPPELTQGPRERLLAAGPSVLSDGELLGLPFGIGSREKTAVELAGEVTSREASKISALRFSARLTEEVPEVEPVVT